MSASHAPHTHVPFGRLFCTLALIAIGSTTLFAAEPAEKLAGSLKFVPATASAYSVSLRNHELIDAIAKSKAWAKLREMPLVKKAWEALEGEPQFADALDQIKDFFAQDENKELLALLGEMVGDEVFMYGDDEWPKVANLAQQIQTAINYGPMFAQLTGGDIQLARARAFLNILDAHRDQLKVPHAVVGFKLRDKQRAEKQLKRLEALATAAAGMVPHLQGRVQTQKVGETNYLVLSLDGGMIPWDNIPIKDFEDDAGQYDKLVAKLKAMKAVLGIGIRDDYLLVSVGESLEPMAKWGEGPKLAARPEFKQLANFADKRVNSISYVSKDARAALERGGDQIAYFKTEIAKTLEAVPLPDETKKRMKNDLDSLAADLSKTLPNVGAELMVSYYSARGIEGFTYDWSERASTDGSKPLGLLQHVGAAPLAFAASRYKPSLDGYEMLVKWGKVVHGYFEDFALPLMGNEDRGHYDKFMKFFVPLLGRIDQTTRTKLFPALADGQFAFVLDARIASKQWIKSLPATNEALPIFEPALVWGVSDAEMLKTAMAEYRDALNDFFSSFNLEDNPLALWRISNPEEKELKTGTLYSYHEFDEAGLDKQITPNAGLSKTIAVASISPKQTDRILTETPLAVPGLLEDTKRPLAGAAYFNVAGTIDALTPWIDLGVRQLCNEPGFLNLFNLLADEGVRPNLKPAADDPPEVKEILGQVHTLLDVVKVLRSYTSITYRENNVWVTHYEMVIQDVP